MSEEEWMMDFDSAVPHKSGHNDLSRWKQFGGSLERPKPPSPIPDDQDDQEKRQSIEEEWMKKGLHIICVGCKTQRVMTLKEAGELKPGETVACKECGNVMA